MESLLLRPEGSVDVMVEHQFRQASAEILADLLHRFGAEHLGLAEDVVQEAMLKALRRWPFHGIPDHPKAWLKTVAHNLARDRLRRSGRQRSMSETAELADDLAVADRHADEIEDDVLRMIFLCCQESISAPTRVALTLKLVGGFGSDEIARAFLLDRSAIQQRLLRAKKKLREASADLDLPAPEALTERLDSVLDVIYLMFNAGYAADRGRELMRRELIDEAIRLVALLVRNPMTAQPRVHALAALFEFHAARLATRTDESGRLQLLADQDRGAWDASRIEAGYRHLMTAMQGEDLSRFHLEAGIASCHAAAPRAADTDWRQISSFYDQLLELTRSPVVALNRCVALAMSESPALGLAELEKLSDRESLERFFRYHAVRGELLSLTGDRSGARAAFKRAASMAGSDPEREFLSGRIAE